MEHSDAAVTLGILLAAIGAAIALLGKFFPKKPAPVPAPSDVQKDEDKKAADAEKKAADKEKQDVVVAKDEHDKEISAVVAKEEGRVVAVGDDPKAVNDFLKDIGSSVRQ